MLNSIKDYAQIHTESMQMIPGSVLEGAGRLVPARVLHADTCGKYCIVLLCTVFVGVPFGFF